MSIEMAGLDAAVDKFARFAQDSIRLTGRAVFMAAVVAPSDPGYPDISKNATLRAVDAAFPGEMAGALLRVAMIRSGAELDELKNGGALAWYVAIAFIPVREDQDHAARWERLYTVLRNEAPDFPTRSQLSEEELICAIGHTEAQRDHYRLAIKTGREVLPKGGRRT